MSKSELKPKAKELYTIHQLSLADISRRLNISTRTLQTWKSEDHWDEARAAVSGGEKNFHAELFELGEVMAKSSRMSLTGSRWPQNATPHYSASSTRQNTPASMKR